MTPAKPSLELLRSLTDEHVLRALMDHPRLTRAEIATRTGLSKPTASESARRLTEVGLLRDTGERTTGRGRIGSYYALAADLGTALAVDISPAAVVVEAVDVYGHTVRRSERPLPRPTDPAHVADALRSGARDGRARPPRRRQRRRSRRPRHRATRPPARRAVPGRRALARRRPRAPSSTAPSRPTTT